MNEELKIIATIRKRSSTLELLQLINKLYAIGIKDFRFNISKCENEASLHDLSNAILKVKEESLYKKISIMLDVPIPGSKPRVRLKQGDIYIAKGNIKILTGKNDCLQQDESNKIGVNIRDFGALLSKKQIIYCSDGEGIFLVEEILNNNEVIVKAMNSFRLFNGKSLVCGKVLKDNFLKDAIMNFIQRINPSSVVFSFVESKEDVKEYINSLHNIDCELISKIETDKGVENIREIAQISDGIMIGRGDLGLYADITKLAFFQEYIAENAHEHKKELYVATDILDSLFLSNIPSRAEIIDITNTMRLKPRGIILSNQLILSEHVEEVLRITGKIYHYVNNYTKLINIK